MPKTRPGTAKRVTCPLSPKYEGAKEMYESGLSLAAVGQRFGRTRQAMWDILKRRGAKLRPQKTTGLLNPLFRGGSFASDQAQNKLEKAILRGEINRPNRCQECGGTKKFRDGRSGIQAHHPDYNKPLEVMWLCQPCHHRWHQTHRAVPAKNG